MKVAGFLFFLVLFSLLFLPKELFAHNTMKPHFFKVDNVYVEPYAILHKSVAGFDLPNEIAPGPFLVNQPINFEIDLFHLGNLKAYGDKTIFAWDFGDRERGGGTKNVHTYKNVGSYILKLNIQFSPDAPPSPLAIILINVLPNKEYKLSDFEIVVNDDKVDPISKKAFAKFTNLVKFESNFSSKGSSELVEYLWDFGDGTSSDEKNPSHQYDSKHYNAFVSLTVKDKRGFIKGLGIELVNGANPAGDTIKKEDSIFLQDPILVVVIVLMSLAFIGFLVKSR